ncbi:Outer membrane protein (porin) [Variovorax sp. OV329]|nr:Outer membrane protein (porin) [Variovorax sp. OV329]
MRHQLFPRVRKNPFALSAMTALTASLAGLALPASAQSSVTIYGLIDVAVGQYDGPSRGTIMNTGATSRLGFRGAEDLGGGLKAIFQLEHQFNPDDGTQYNPSAFFSGRSTVGLEGFFGRVTLGREVNASHYVEAGADPFGQDGLPAGYGARGGISQANGGPGQIDTVRTNNSINWAYTLGSFTFRAQGAMREGADPTGNKPYSASVIYASGPLQLGISTLNPSKVNDNWSYVSGQYDFNVARLFAGFGEGRNTFDQKMRNGMVGVLVPVGPWQLKASYSHTEADGNSIQDRVAMGAFYFLSKRTVVYGEATNDKRAGDYAYGIRGWQPSTGSIIKINGTGYDVGLRHYF